MQVTCHPRLGGARPSGGRGSPAYLSDKFYLKASEDAVSADKVQKLISGALVFEEDTAEG